MVVRARQMQHFKCVRNKRKRSGGSGPSVNVVHKWVCADAVNVIMFNKYFCATKETSR